MLIMPLHFNIRHLEDKNLTLAGELSAEELGLEGLDELIHFPKPAKYQLEVQQSGDGILVQGELKLEFQCECARCLKAFPYEIRLKDWTVHLPLMGEEKVEVDNDCIDLTPFFREDILLEFPQHPLCKPECRGLLQAPFISDSSSPETGQRVGDSSPWSELNKLKFKE